MMTMTGEAGATGDDGDDDDDVRCAMMMIDGDEGDRRC